MTCFNDDSYLIEELCIWLKGLNLTPSITTDFHYANKSNLFSFESKKRNLIAYSFYVLFIRNGMVYHIEYELMSL